jgi:hypothetical protein
VNRGKVCFGKLFASFIRLFLYMYIYALFAVQIYKHHYYFGLFFLELYYFSLSGL